MVAGIVFVAFLVLFPAFLAAVSAGKHTHDRPNGSHATRDGW